MVVTSMVLELGVFLFFFGGGVLVPAPALVNWVTFGKGIYLSVEGGRHRTHLKGFLRPIVVP